MAIKNCKYCDLSGIDSLWSSFGAVLSLPLHPHVSSADGGHLIAIPRRHVADRRVLSPRENLAVVLATCIGADALGEAFKTDWQNYQENGNWGANSVAGPHMHVHIYGRRKGSVTQPFGEPLRLPRTSEDARMEANDLSIEDIERLRSAVTNRDFDRYSHYEAAIRLLENS